EGNASLVSVSVNSGGVSASGDAFHAAITSDGRFVAFDSWASNLVPDDTNGFYTDVFVHDRDPDRNGIFDEGNGVTVRVDVSSAGEEGESGGQGATISADGRFVGFHSFSKHLISDDTNGTTDVFVHDRDPDENGVFDEANGITIRTSVSSGGAEANDA